MINYSSGWRGGMFSSWTDKPPANRFQFPWQLHHPYDRVPPEAIVETIIRPNSKGRVRFQGSWWPARCLKENILHPGEVVWVVGTDNITLIVEAVTCDLG